MASCPLHCDVCRKVLETILSEVEICHHIHCQDCSKVMTMDLLIHGGIKKPHHKCLVCHRFGRLIKKVPSYPAYGHQASTEEDRHIYLVRKYNNAPYATSSSHDLWDSRQSHGGRGQSHDGSREKHGGSRESHDGSRQSHDGSRQSYGGSRESHDGSKESHDGSRQKHNERENVRSIPVHSNEQAPPVQRYHKEHEIRVSQQGHDIKDQTDRYPISGLQNSKLTCAINAVIQVLAQTPGFCDAVFDNCTKRTKKDLALILLDVILSVNNSPGQISAEALQAEIIGREDDFHFWRQHDCHSFLLCLLEALREDLGKDSMGLFTGRITTRFECQSCTQKECSEPQDFTSLCIPLTEKSVDEGIQLLFRKESLVDSKMLCRSCDKGQKVRTGYLCSKKLLLETAPSVLLLQLVRFKEVRTKNGLMKIEKRQNLVPYSEILKLTCGKSPVKYKLFAIISHLGTIEGGHYVSYVRTLQDQCDLTSPTHRDKRGHDSRRSSTWYHCTDSIVTRVNPDDGYPICSNAYLLFYHKLP